MTLYSKTMAGRIAAVDQKSNLPEPLKKFLKSVDGKTPPDQLAARWSCSQEAAQLLQDLEARGLVEIKAVRWNNSAANSVFTDSTQPAPLMNLAPAKQSPVKKKKPTDLEAVKDKMATFVLTHLPHYALPVVQEIEDLSSYEQLTQMLSAYANLVREAGRDGQEHIRTLRIMLEPGHLRSVY
jgi:hypothetical protein